MFKLRFKILCLGCFFETEAIQNIKTGTITCLVCGHKFKTYQCRACGIKWISDDKEIKPYTYTDAWGNKNKLCPKCHSNRWDIRIFRTIGQYLSEGEVINQIRDASTHRKSIGIISKDRNTPIIIQNKNIIQIHSVCKYPVTEKNDKLYCAVCDYYIPENEIMINEYY